VPIVELANTANIRRLPAGDLPYINRGKKGFFAVDSCVVNGPQGSLLIVIKSIRDLAGPFLTILVISCDLHFQFTGVL